MRLHWCALDDPGGALGLKNRLMRPVKKMIDYETEPLSDSYWFVCLLACKLLLCVAQNAWFTLEHAS